jgi:U3 small nucleolar RNA-associated protein 10
MYHELILGHVVPCVAQFSEVIIDRNLWKALNYQVLLKTRHPSSRIRLGALRVMKQLYVRMGEEFVSLLPETIPFLSELMEDESEEVEQECQSIIRTLEETLGESLQPYF